jgi:hypothetical protein
MLSIRGRTHPEQRFFIFEKSTQETSIFVQTLKYPRSYDFYLFIGRILQIAFGNHQDKDTVTSIDGFKDKTWVIERGGKRREVGKGI